MGMLGELFPGKKLTDEGGEDSDGKLHRPRFDIDLDSGVVRLPNRAPRQPAVEQPEPDDQPRPADQNDQPRPADQNDHPRPADQN
jgi:hypothetical protein